MASYIGVTVGCLAVIAVLIGTTLYVGKYRHIDFKAMSGEGVKIQTRSVEAIRAGSWTLPRTGQLF